MTGYHIYFERAFGEYMWNIIFHAGREFDIIPVGSSAVELLGWRFG
jgi:glycine cleavage system aminomethyltransferase T